MHLFILSSAPFGSAAVQETIDILISALSFDRDIALVLKDEACQLLQPLDAAPLAQKNPQKLLSVLPIYGLEQIYVAHPTPDPSWELAGCDLQPLDANGLATMISEAREVSLR